jgi:hypothetical protein
VKTLIIAKDLLEPWARELLAGFEVVAAFGVGGKLALEAGRRTRQYHFDAGNSGAGRVADKTVDGAAIQSLRGSAKCGD